ncbi:helix-turn-helix transcriptional regulator, partial [Enterobacter hormaechei]
AMSLSEDTVSSLVDKTGIPNSTIRSYLKGESVPGIMQLRKIAAGMGIKAGWFLGDDEEFACPKDGISEIEKDLELLNNLFKYMAPVQRGRVLKRVLASVARQIDHNVDGDNNTEQ